MLSSTESSSGAEPVIHYTGLSTEAVASGLKPFTHYTAVLKVDGQNRISFQRPGPTFSYIILIPNKKDKYVNQLSKE